MNIQSTKYSVIILLFLIVSCGSQNVMQEINSGITKNTNPLIDAKVEALLAKMTLTDKCGEMTQLTLDMLMQGQPYNVPEPQKLDTKKLQNVLVDLSVGSILNCSGHAFTKERWNSIIDTIQDYAINKKESGIPVLYGVDAIHGTTYTVNSTLFPQQLSLAASWNPSLAYEMGRVTAYETRASSIPWNFSPVLDIGRSGIWPRLWETFGEDPLLASAFGVELVKGYQGDDISSPYSVAACLKHFLGYSIPTTGKDRTPALIPERQLRQYFLPTFEAAIKADAATVMINSGEMNGIPVHINKEILTDLLRNELGFEGIAVTDWADIDYLVSRHRVAKDYKEAIAMAINAGVDMSMVPIDTKYPVLLKELVEEGKVPMSRINESVKRILKVKYKLGLFEEQKKVSYDKFGSAEFQQKSLEAAIESIVLAKNENNVLPLSAGKRVFVTGPNANTLNSLNGGWTRTWQGNDAKWNTAGKLTILEAVQKSFGSVTYAEGCTYDKAVDISAAVQKARQADVIVAALGEMPYTEVPGNIDDLNLPQVQYDLINALAETGKPIVLIMVEGRPRTIRQIIDKVDAVLLPFLPGDEGAPALVKILNGEANPSAKLPITYPQFANDPITYDYKGTVLQHTDFSENGFRPQFEFGHGLSYTNFEYKNLKLSAKDVAKSVVLNITVDVTNKGSRSGKEVVQLYVNDLVASITPSIKKLRAFDKIELAAGETKTVNFKIKSEDLAFVGVDNKWITEAGEFEVQIADLKDKFMMR